VRARYGMSIFGEVVVEYDAARPHYPPELFEALGDLRGRDLLDVGAGTGIATRRLLARGARVTAVDTSPEMLRRAKSWEPTLVATAGDGARLPQGVASFDAVTFAQSWHWTDPEARVDEVARVLRAGGAWSAWWSHARADGETWFERCWEAIEAACPGVNRSQRDIDWGRELVRSHHFGRCDMVRIAWGPGTDTATWLSDLRSQSHIATLGDAQRSGASDEVGALLHEAFPEGRLSVPNETRLWTAIRNDSPT
jgi:SAM-dependent methyltransferase